MQTGCRIVGNHHEVWCRDVVRARPMQDIRLEVERLLKMDSLSIDIEYCHNLDAKIGPSR